MRVWVPLEGDILDIYADQEILLGHTSLGRQEVRDVLVRVWRERGERAPFPEDLFQYLRQHYPRGWFRRLAKWWRQR